MDQLEKEAHLDLKKELFDEEDKKSEKKILLM